VRRNAKLPRAGKAPSQSHPWRGRLFVLLEVGLFYLFLKYVLFALFTAFLYEPLPDRSVAMEPTILGGDLFLVEKFAYGYTRDSFPGGLAPFSGRIFASDPKLGDVVVVRWPGEGRRDYVRRVIGLPGDHIQMIEGVLNINGRPVGLQRLADNAPSPFGPDMRSEEDLEILPNGVRHPILRFPALDGDSMNNTAAFVVPPGQFFVLADNRDDSADSRLGPVYLPMENLVGRAVLLLGSINGGHFRFDRLLQRIP
jgi:signal peptidase I